MAEILYAPNREQVVTTNAWAFLHWLRTVRGVDLAGWAALQRWSARDPASFRAAISAFAITPASDAVSPSSSPSPPSWPGLARPSTSSRCPPKEASDGWSMQMRALADVLLFADIRPDDRLLVAGSTWPWRVAQHQGTAMIASGSTDLLALAATERATVLITPATSLTEMAFQRHGRPDLAALRTIIATGGPLSPEGRRRIYTWVKSDLMLLASTGSTYWGNPLEPVLAQPPATPAFLTLQTNRETGVHGYAL